MGAGKSKSSSSSSSTSTSSSTLGPDDPNGRRMAIAQEVLSTERSYVASLELCQTVRVARIVLAHALGSLTSRHHDHLLARSLALSRRRCCSAATARCQVWYEPIEASTHTKKPIIKPADLSKIFSNLPEIIQVQKVCVPSSSPSSFATILTRLLSFSHSCS